MSTLPLYRGIAKAAVPLLPFVFRDPRQRDAHRARLEAPTSLERWATVHRDSNRPLTWFHASSVGEGLQARAVIAEWRAGNPRAQLIYTHFSPSAESLALAIGADWTGYLCYDRRADVDRMLAAARANVLVFTKLDLWPELANRAARLGTRVVLVAGTVSEASGRLRWPARSLAAAGYATLSRAGAIAADDASRLVQLGCPAAAITVTGDPRIDSALQAISVDGEIPLPTYLDRRNTLVAGSTWPADERVVLEALAIVRRTHPEATLVIAPHEPTPAHLRRLEADALRLGLDVPARLSTLLPGTRPRVIVIDRVGVLARAYASGAVAYVGGGYGSAGIHSVIEPAAAGCTTVIGPRDRGSRDAKLLEAVGALHRLGESGATQLAAFWHVRIDDPAQAKREGQSALVALEPERGAAVRSADLIGGA